VALPPSRCAEHARVRVATARRRPPRPPLARSPYSLPSARVLALAAHAAAQSLAAEALVRARVDARGVLPVSAPPTVLALAPLTAALRDKGALPPPA
jgi:hypothetical protein